MSFQSLDQILRSLSKPVVNPQQEPLEQLIAVWPNVVGEKTARFSRPSRLAQGILQVATANAVWAQQLTFQRRRLLDQLNPHLDEPLQDIRLSPRLWHQDIHAPEPNPDYQLSEHPSCWRNLDDSIPSPQLGHNSSSAREIPEATSASPQQAFEALLQKLAVRTHGLPLCPACHCPTPVGELERWSVCAVCAVSSPALER